MSSSRLILVFLGFIFLIIVILTSSQIAGALRSRFGNLIPGYKVANERVTPTPTKVTATPTLTPTLGSRINSGTAGSTYSNKSHAAQTPATGPSDLILVLLGSGGGIGLLLRKISQR